MIPLPTFPRMTLKILLRGKHPSPVWFVATYKDDEENYVKATDTLHRGLNGIPSNNIKRYGRNTLVKSKIQFKVNYYKVTNPQNTLI